MTNPPASTITTKTIPRTVNPERVEVLSTFLFNNSTSIADLFWRILIDSTEVVILEIWLFIYFSNSSKFLKLLNTNKYILIIFIFFFKRL